MFVGVVGVKMAEANRDKSKDELTEEFDERELPRCVGISVTRCLV